MQGLFQRWRIVTVDHGMDIKVEGNGSITQFLNPICRLQPARHTYLEYVLTKTANVTDDINMTSSGLLRHRNRPLPPALRLCQFGFQISQLGFVLRTLLTVSRSQLLTGSFQGLL